MKTLALITTLSMMLLLVNGLPVVYAAPETWDISTGNLVISSGGTYAVTGSTTSNTISVNTSDAVTITLDNVSIDVSATSDQDRFRQWRKCHALPQRIEYSEEQYQPARYQSNRR